MDDETALTLSLHAAIADIPAAEWDACAGPDNPFVSHEFLSVCEDSGSAGARTGWLPQHAALRDGLGRLVAVVPMYAKSHSYGEYVFDHGWANAFERAGGSYYPKLQVAVPFSPVPGPRILIRPDLAAQGAGIGVAEIGAALIQACTQLKLSSVHVTFCTEAEQAGLVDAGFLPRIGKQFHWQDRGYGDFDGFLGALSSRKRKSIRRERRDAQNCGLVFRALQGADITGRHWDAFYRFYADTVDRKWGSAYLTRSFFPLLPERLGDRVVLMVAEQDGVPVAGALNLMGSDTLYGRNWGAAGEFPFLHFELCYYQAIDFALAHGLTRVEAGAQGEHKIQRGYLPQTTFSAHWIAHRGLREAIGGFLDRERPAVRAEMEELATLSPFRRDGATD